MRGPKAKKKAEVAAAELEKHTGADSDDDEGESEDLRGISRVPVKPICPRTGQGGYSTGFFEIGLWILS